MLDCLRCFVLEILDQIKFSVTGLKELLRDLLNPSWDSGREHQALQVFQTSALDLVHDEDDIFFETKVEHLVSFVKDGILEI